MRLFIANYQPQKYGGGWTQSRYIHDGFSEELTNYEQSEIYFIPSPSMVNKEDVERAKDDNKKIVVRVDNILRNSRNRNSGMSRMKKFVDLADVVIYQSEWAKDMLQPLLKRSDGVVIHNSCDTSIFNFKNREENEHAQFIYSRVNRDETKNWEMARFIYQEECARRGNEALLNIVGAYSPELVEYNFDFYNGELYRYWGTVTDPQFMANLYRKSDYLIFTFFNDACSNTLIEALCSGCQILDNYHMADTGGSEEILHYWHKHGGEDYFGLPRMIGEYRKVFESL